MCVILQSVYLSKMCVYGKISTSDKKYETKFGRQLAKLLLVEDDDEILNGGSQMLKSYLEAENYEVICAKG